ncbi:MAG: DNA-directed RNA polymerase subunit B, partial [Candidatus Micrarchaeota archaeon]
MVKKKRRERPKIEKTAVYINGRLVGFHPKGDELIKTLLEMRRKGEISPEANFAHHPRTGELYINTDAGRARRPYIVVENGKSKLTEELKKKLAARELSWADLVKMGVVEYLDAEEEDDHAYVALGEKELTPEHT